MLIFTRSLRVWLALDPVYLRKSFDGLAAQVQHALEEDERSSQVFVLPTDGASAFECCIGMELGEGDESFRFLMTILILFCTLPSTLATCRMNSWSKRVLVLALVMIGISGAWWKFNDSSSTKKTSTAAALKQPRPIPDLTNTKNAKDADGAAHEESASSEEEQHKEIDREHLKNLHAALFAYKKRHGTFPEYLSQLVPEFVSADALNSPRKPDQGMNIFAQEDHPDPGVEKPAYGFEFSNLEFRDGRTFAEIKEVQRAEWGDAVPILRAFGYEKVINMAYGGELYETALNWEWDAATLDVVEKLGWGPGLTVGEMVRVRVVGPDGSPQSNAQVWADGRNYSFDLPNRPYPTDADGYATIPLGADVDRTALRLRAEAPGLASQVASFQLGEFPAEHSLSLATADRVGGVAVGIDGQVLPYAHVLLRQASDGGSGGPELATVKADSNGRWQASLPPGSVNQLTGVVGVPGGYPLKLAPAQTISATDAKAGTAKVAVPSQP